MERSLKHIIVENADGVVKVILNRPPLNVLNIEMLLEIASVLNDLIDDQRLKLLVFTGNGKAFSAGVDVGEHLPEKAREMLSVFQRTYELLTAIEAPTLAVVNGVALGGGCEIAVLCDLVIAAESAKIGQPEIKLATLAPVAAAVFPHLCGTRKALELLLTGESITAAEAARIGLITRAVPDGELQTEAKALADRLVGLSSKAVRAVKKSIRSALSQSLDGAVEEATKLCLDMLLHSPDSQEGLLAFLEKRRPTWAGR
jgi:cyclohexa-1,5-dienecarbonyl-CoA hydratase